MPSARKMYICTVGICWLCSILQTCVYISLSLTSLVASGDASCFMLNPYGSLLLSRYS
ncbi:hypothetical protein BJY00DRAFT_287822 [Aspergillus carlsbadensis]|nr:hypothetical protein BJY00DRAFT_287822 [Aspergillus carlsbadensis]